MSFEKWDAIDRFIQWLAIDWLYAREQYTLPLVALLLLITSLFYYKHLMRILFWAVALCAVSYLYLYEMHWHSVLACPLLLSAVCYCFARERWQKVVAYRLPGSGAVDRLLESRKQVSLWTRGALVLAVALAGYAAFTLLAWATYVFVPKSSWLLFFAFVAFVGAAAYEYAGLPTNRKSVARGTPPRPAIWRTFLNRLWESVRPFWPTVVKCGAVLVFIASLPWSSFCLAIAAIPLGALFLIALTLLGGGRWLLYGYLAMEPRLGTYFDCARSLNAKRTAGPEPPLLAEERFDRSTLLAESGDDHVFGSRWGLILALVAGVVLVLAVCLWSAENSAARVAGVIFGAMAVILAGMSPWLFWLGHRPVIGHVIWMICRHRFMPVFDSRYVSDFLRQMKDHTWSKYEKRRYGRSVDKYRKQVSDRTPLPAELNAGETPGERVPLVRANARSVRLRWLAQTEALAECQFFDHLGATDETGLQPQLVRASALLSAAGEIQHEVAKDLSRYLSGGEAGAPGPESADDLVRFVDRRMAHELRLAQRFFDLSARCLELFLDPDYAEEMTQEDAPTRCERFCAELTDTSWWEKTRELTLSQQDADDNDFVPQTRFRKCHLRLALFWHYLLIATLETQVARGEPGAAGVPAAADAHPLQHWLDGRADTMFKTIVNHAGNPRFALPYDDEGPAANVCACLSYIIAAGWGGVGETLILDLLPHRKGGRHVDPLTLFGALLNEVEAKPEAKRFWLLRGRFWEQQMYKLPEGGVPWWEACQKGAESYVRAGSCVWRLYEWGTRIDPPAPPVTTGQEI